jgi:hypothetical protein
MGFTGIGSASQPLSPNRIVAVVAVVFAIFFTGAFVVGTALQDANLNQILFRSLMIANIYGAAVFCALVPKSRWRIAALDEAFHRPAIGYLISGVLAMIASAAITLVFRSMMEQSLLRAAQDFQWSYPWLAMAFVAATAIAYLADDFADSREPPRWARWAEGAGLALLLALAAFVVVEWLNDLPNRPAHRRVPSLSFVLSMSSLIGFWIGATVPSWYRRSLHRYQRSASSPAAPIAPLTPVAPSLAPGEATTGY